MNDRLLTRQQLQEELGVGANMAKQIMRRYGCKVSERRYVMPFSKLLDYLEENPEGLEINWNN